MYIVYKTTNLINGKIYVGVHYQNNEEDFDGYYGSGHILLKAIKRYGKENFIRETLLKFVDREDAYKKEREIVDADFILREDTYNITIGGDAPPSHKGRTKTLEHRKRIGESQKGKTLTEGTKQKIRDARKHQTISHSEETRRKIGLSRLGKQHTTESKKRMSDNHADYSGVNNPMYGRRGEDNPKYGIKVSDVTKERLKKAALQRQDTITCPHCDVTGKRSGMLRWHFNNCKLAVRQPTDEHASVQER